VYEEAVSPERAKDSGRYQFKDDPFGQRGYDGIKGSPEGTVTTLDYKFPKPGMSDPVPKRSFITRIGDQGCGVGYYK